MYFFQKNVENNAENISQGTCFEENQYGFKLSKYAFSNINTFIKLITLWKFTIFWQFHCLDLN